MKVMSEKVELVEGGIHITRIICATDEDAEIKVKVKYSGEEEYKQGDAL